MGRCHGNMITTGNGVIFFGKADRRQELLHREVRKLYNLRIPVIDKGKQCGARRQHRLERFFWAPILAKLWNLSCLEIKCEKLCQFRDIERAGSYRNTLEYPLGKFPVCVADVSQG